MWDGSEVTQSEIWIDPQPSTMLTRFPHWSAELDLKRIPGEDLLFEVFRIVGDVQAAGHCYKMRVIGP